MSLNDFIKKGLVKKGEVDKGLASSLVKVTLEDLKFLDDLEINVNSARKLMTNYYDCLRAVLEAIAALEGIKSYSHEAFTFFLKEKNEESIAEKFDRLRKIRNGISYYGKEISVDEVKEHKREIIELINKLKEKYLERKS